MAGSRAIRARIHQLGRVEDSQRRQCFDSLVSDLHHCRTLADALSFELVHAALCVGIYQDLSLDIAAFTSKYQPRTPATPTQLRIQSSLRDVAAQWGATFFLQLRDQGVHLPTVPSKPFTDELRKIARIANLSRFSGVIKPIFVVPRPGPRPEWSANGRVVQSQDLKVAYNILSDHQDCASPSEERPRKKPRLSDSSLSASPSVERPRNARTSSELCDLNNHCDEDFSHFSQEEESVLGSGEYLGLGGSNFFNPSGSELFDLYGSGASHHGGSESFERRRESLNRGDSESLDLAGSDFVLLDGQGSPARTTLGSAKDDVFHGSPQSPHLGFVRSPTTAESPASPRTTLSMATPNIDRQGDAMTTQKAYDMARQSLYFIKNDVEKQQQEASAAQQELKDRHLALKAQVEICRKILAPCDSVVVSDEVVFDRVVMTRLSDFIEQREAAIQSAHALVAELRQADQHEMQLRNMLGMHDPLASSEKRIKAIESTMEAANKQCAHATEELAKLETLQAIVTDTASRHDHSVKMMEEAIKRFKDFIAEWCETET
ncbi:hypothetical protein BU23DRAFT_133916 [Bimuria novae-zelandiae CBS 107.79]|uniref:Uncharacterized protein n=1 Tax=Bimuria novae-zelandiae CBS 107.79 TaxID=1447943 RepID=A0A6A5VIS3_9PLEO|nr:hypothetical protein BU23DRAFT_133916 [Bimuria novae-zelandiae CBS 107.79]